MIDDCEYNNRNNLTLMKCVGTRQDRRNLTPSHAHITVSRNFSVIHAIKYPFMKCLYIFSGGANACVLACSVTDKDSFLALPKWKNKVGHMHFLFKRYHIELCVPRPPDTKHTHSQ